VALTLAPRPHLLQTGARPERQTQNRQKAQNTQRPGKPTAPSIRSLRRPTSIWWSDDLGSHW